MAEEHNEEEADKVRLILYLQPALKDKVVRAKERLGAPSVSEVVRRAINLFDVVEPKLTEGCSVLIRDRDGNEKEIIII